MHIGVGRVLRSQLIGKCRVCGAVPAHVAECCVTELAHQANADSVCHCAAPVELHHRWDPQPKQPCIKPNLQLPVQLCTPAVLDVGNLLLCLPLSHCHLPHTVHAAILPRHFTSCTNLSTYMCFDCCQRNPVIVEANGSCLGVVWACHRHPRCGSMQ